MTTVEKREQCAQLVTRYPSTLDIQGGSGSGFSTDATVRPVRACKLLLRINPFFTSAYLNLSCCQRHSCFYRNAAASRALLPAAILTAAAQVSNTCLDTLVTAISNLALTIISSDGLVLL